MEEHNTEDEKTIDAYRRARQREFDLESTLELLHQEAGDISTKIVDAEKSGNTELLDVLKKEHKALRNKIRETRLKG